MRGPNLIDGLVFATACGRRLSSRRDLTRGRNVYGMPSLASGMTRGDGSVGDGAGRGWVTRGHR